MENYANTVQEISELSLQIDSMFLTLERINVIDNQVVNNVCSVETLQAIDPDRILFDDAVPSVETLREFTAKLFKRVVEFIKKMIKRLKLLFSKVKHVFKTKDRYVKKLIDKLDDVTELAPEVYDEKFSRPNASLGSAGKAISVLFFQLFNFDGVDPNLPRFSVKLKTFGQTQFIPTLNLPDNVADVKSIFDDELKDTFKMEIIEAESIELDGNMVKVFDVHIAKKWELKETKFEKKLDPLFETKKDLRGCLSLMRDGDNFDEALDRYNKRFELMSRQLDRFTLSDDNDKDIIEGLLRLWKHHTKALTHISSQLTMLINAEVSGTIVAANVVLKHAV